MTASVTAAASCTALGHHHDPTVTEIEATLRAAEYQLEVAIGQMTAATAAVAAATRALREIRENGS